MTASSSGFDQGEYRLDGVMYGALAIAGCGVVFWSCRGFVKGCFAATRDISFAFEAELAVFILKIENFRSSIA